MSDKSVNAVENVAKSNTVESCGIPLNRVSAFSGVLVDADGVENLASLNAAESGRIPSNLVSLLFGVLETSLIMGWVYPHNEARVNSKPPGVGNFFQPVSHPSISVRAQYFSPSSLWRNPAESGKCIFGHIS